MENKEIINTGIKQIDDLLTNGINKDSLNVVIGLPRSNKPICDTIYMQIYMERAIKAFEKYNIDVMGIKTNTDPIF